MLRRGLVRRETAGALFLKGNKGTKMRKFEITYRLGVANFLPRERQGNEIRETTSEPILKWLDDAERKTGPVSIVAIQHATEVVACRI
jgi:hypothetical protein